MTAAEFELLTEADAECLLRRRLKTFIATGADPGKALILAAQVELPEAAVVKLLQLGFAGGLIHRLLYAVERAA